MEKQSCIRKQADFEQILRCRDRVQNQQVEFDRLSGGFDMMGNPARLKMAYLLFKEQKLCVCDLSDILQMSVPAISQHLRKMKDRHLISTDRQAQTIYYSLTPSFATLMENYFLLLDHQSSESS